MVAHAHRFYNIQNHTKLSHFVQDILSALLIAIANEIN